ncbi:MAG: hypothetical protein DHS20C18_10140 [Saprospiraceae bacterium]|nr:MAG: hypothetical protein DHS20C18_10140 [Saprospiraceae bacterium]
MNSVNFLGLLLLLLTIEACKQPEPERILVFSKTTGIRHASIPAGQEALLTIAAEKGWIADTTENAELLTEENLQRYAALIFLNTSGSFLNTFQQADLQRYLQSGGSFVGIHSACETERDWPWFQDLIGIQSTTHLPKTTFNIQVKDAKHPATAKLPTEFSWTDEGYDFGNKTPIGSLLNATGKNGMQCPISWYREYDGGRVFYTGLGHSIEIFQDPTFREHLKGGIQYAIGNNKRDYSKASTARTPDEDRFVKVTLVDSVWVEPIEMAILPNLDILVIQRRGEVMYYQQETKELVQAAKLDVFFKAENPKTRSEQGLVGITIDPNFANNNFVYLFYSPTAKEVNRLSRFVLRDKKLDLNSEKIILEFYSERDICCHTGGSLAFGPNRMLYLSTGDNTSPSHQKKDKTYPDGYGSIDNRPEFMEYDATRTSGNTNSLQGKILRIRMNEDGTYDIPEDNLFPEGTPNAHPEIYVMGARNPYRISVDQKTGYLYWCDIGPDAEETHPIWGPIGTDEINQTREAGNYGWPFFSANNQAYRDFDYVTGKQGDFFDPLHPVNHSYLNTGLRELPPAKGAMIWYPYSESAEFPQMGTGTRNGMAGPVYNMEYYPEETRLPAAYDGKLFIYEWIRDFIKVVTLDSSGNYVGMEPFMSSTFFSHPIDMEIGPDGRLYVLEYGQGWYIGNEDSGLYRIDFTEGNRPPKTKLTADRTSGAVPLHIQFSAAESEDPDGGNLSYLWDFGDGNIEETTMPTLAHVFNKVGDYRVFLTAIDEQGAATRTGPLDIYAGNEAPELSIQLEGNQQFYFPGKPIKYRLVATDKEDGILEGTAIPPAQFDLKLDYLTVAKPVLGHRAFSEAEIGAQHITENDCSSCHKKKDQSAGPSYEEVAIRYHDQKGAVDYLSTKILKGGSGVWGTTAMSPHPTINKATAELIAKYILSLAKDESQLPSLPASGTFHPGQGKKTDPKTVVLLKASFTDRGGSSARPLQSITSLQLSYPKIEAEGTEKQQNIEEDTWQKEAIAKTTAPAGWLSYAACDFTDINRFTVRYVLTGEKAAAYQLSFHLDAPDSPAIANMTIGANESVERFHEEILDFNAPKDGQLHALYVKYERSDAGDEGSLGIDGYFLMMR